MDTLLERLEKAKKDFDEAMKGTLEALEELKKI